MINKRFLKSHTESGWQTVLGQMGKFGENKILTTIRDSFAMLIPILIAGSLAIIVRIFLFSANNSIASSILGWIGLAHTSIINGGIIPIFSEVTAASGPIFVDIHGVYQFNSLFQVTNGMAIYQLIQTIGSDIFVPLQVGVFDHIALFTCMTIAYNVSRQQKSDSPIFGVLVGVTALLVISGGSNAHLKWSGTSLPFDATRLLPAMLSSFVFVSLFEWLSKNEKMVLKMPEGVPPAVARSFAKLFPAVITLLIAIAANGLFSGVSYFAGLPGYSLAAGISDGIQGPFLTIISQREAQVGVGLLYVMLVALLWFFGIHGSNVLGGIFSPILIASTVQNELFLTKGTGEMTILAGGTFDAFVFFGGAGATLALVIATLAFSKKKLEREISKFGGAPGVFNINEPIIFGYPIILNFSLFVPFIFNQIVLFLITYVVIIELQWVPPASVIIPWTSPVGIGAFLATQSWQGAILAIVNFIIAVGIYTPFIFLANKKAQQRGEELVNPYSKFEKILESDKQLNI